MPTLGEARVNIRANLAPLRQGLQSARQAVKKAGDIISTTLKRAALAGAAALTASSIAAAKFERQLGAISTMLDASTMPLMGEYKKVIESLSKSYGESTKSLSAAMYDILSASIKAGKAPEVLRVAARAAKAGLAETNTAASALLTVINSYGLSADRASEISDKLFATVKRGRGDFLNLANSLGRTASSAAVAGLRLDEFLAAYATLTRGGLPAEQAMTAIGGMLRAFLKPAKEAVEAADKLGIGLSSTALKTGGLSKMIKKLKDATPEQVRAIGQSEEGFRGFSGVLKDVGGYLKDVRTIAVDSSGATSEAFQKLAHDTTTGFDKLRQQAVSTARALGEPLLEPLNRAMSYLRLVLGDIEDWFEKNEKLIGKWANLGIAQLARVNAYFGELWDIVNSQGWVAALKKLGADIKKAFTLAITYIKPYAKEIGKLMADSFIATIKGLIKGVLSSETGAGVVGTAGGAKGGAVIGGALAGPPGALAGGLGGALLGPVLILRKLKEDIQDAMGGYWESRKQLGLQQERLKTGTGLPYRPSFEIGERGRPIPSKNLDRIYNVLEDSKRIQDKTKGFIENLASNTNTVF